MIGHFVQRLDKRTGRYLKIDREGNVVGESPNQQPFPGIEEIEPVEVERPAVRFTDPLSDYR
jgi:hypothetical protein